MKVETFSESLENDFSTPKASSGAGAPLEQTKEKKGHEDFSCYHASNPGTLFVSQHRLVFVGSFFSFGKRIELRWEDAEKVDTKEEEGDVNISAKKSAIVIITPVKSYEFTRFCDFGRARSVITSCHHDAVMNPLHTTSSSPPAPPSSPTLMRSNTDPVTSRTFDNPAAAAAKAIFAAAFESGPTPDYRIEEVPEHDQKTNETVQETAGATSGEIDGWNETKKATKEGFPMVPVMSRPLSCDLNSFTDQFIANDSEFLPSFMKDRGDEDMTTSPWILSDDLMWQTRKLHYNHPINAPLAPPKALARKEQRFRKFGEHGLCIETETYTEGVPVSDCFHIKDRILVEPVTDNEDAVHISAYFHVCFTKSSMFQAIVTKTSGSEFTKFLVGLVDLMEVTIEGEKKRKPISNVSQPRISEPQQVPLLPPLQVDPYLYVVIGMFAVILILQYQLSCQIKMIQLSVEIIEQQLHREQLKQICLPE